MRYIYFLFCLILIFPGNLKAEADLSEVSEKASQLRKLLLQAKYKDLTFYFDDYLSARTIAKDGSHYLTAVLENLFSKKASEPELSAINAWIDSDETSAWARVLRVFYFFNQLERFPSAEFRKTKIDSLLQKFIKESAEDAEIAVRLARDNVCARYAHFKVARYQGYKNDYQKRFAVILKLHPQHFQAYLERLIQLSPQWGGSVRDLMNFSKLTSHAVEKTSVLKSLPLFAHKLMAANSKDPKKYLSGKNVIDEMRNAERYASEAFPKSARYLKLFSKLARQGGFIELADRAQYQALDREP